MTTLELIALLQESLDLHGNVDVVMADGAPIRCAFPVGDMYGAHQLVVSDEQNAVDALHGRPVQTGARILSIHRA